MLALLIRARRDQAAAIAALIQSREREGLLIAQSVRSELRTVVSVLRDPDADAAERFSGLPGLVAGSGLDARLTIADGVQEASWSAAAQRAVYRS